MLLKKLILLLATSAFCLPAIAEAGEIEIRSGNIRVNSGGDGEVYVNSRQDRRSLPRTSRINSRDNHYIRQNIRVPGTYREGNYIHQSISVSCSNGRTISRQQSTQTNRSGQTVVQTQVSNYECR